MGPIVVLPAKQWQELNERYEQAMARVIELEKELNDLKEGYYDNSKEKRQLAKYTTFDRTREIRTRFWRRFVADRDRIVDKLRAEGKL